jgi:hypothetical protein
MPQTPMPNPQQMAMAPQNRAGLGAVATDNMTQMAGGGIIAFADEGAVPAPQDSIAPFVTIDPKTKEQKFDTNKFLISELGNRGPSTADYIKSDLEQQRADLEAARQGREKDKWMAASQALLSNTSPFWQVGLGSGLGAYTKAEQESAKDISQRQNDIIKSELQAREHDEAAKNRIIGLAINANTNEENAKLRNITAQYQVGMLQNDKDTKNSLAAQSLFEKTYNANLAANVRDNANSITPMSMDDMKLNSYNTTYAFMSKSKLGQKFLDAYPAPDDYKLTLPSYNPKSQTDTTSAPPKAPETHWYNTLFGGGASPTPASPTATLKYNPATGKTETIQ